MSFCPSCGQQLAEDTRFCPKCGKTVQQETPTEEPAATNPQPTPEQAPQDATAAPQGQFPQESTTSPAITEINPLLPHGPKQYPMLPGETRKDYAARQKPLLKAWKKNHKLAYAGFWVGLIIVLFVLGIGMGAPSRLWEGAARVRPRERV